MSVFILKLLGVTMTCDFFLNADGEPLRFKSSQEAAKAAWVRVMDTASSSLMIYVHGRDIKPNFHDGEPKSSFSEGIVKELERSGTIVLMLHWPHSVPFLHLHDIPVADARAAGPALVDLIDTVAALRPAGKEKSIFIVTHSTGSIVLETAAKADANIGSKVNRVIITSAASDVAGSATWLGRLQCERFVAFNNDDKILGKAANGGPFLGKQRAASFPTTEIAEGVMYLDLTRKKLNHRYFVAAGSSANAEDLERVGARFFRPLYQGKALNMSLFKRVCDIGEIYELA
jgi:esterase/lipase superfamily enzyme